MYKEKKLRNLMIFEDLFHICQGSDAECLSGASI